MVKGQLEEKQALEGTLGPRKNEHTSKGFSLVMWRPATPIHVLPEELSHCEQEPRARPWGAAVSTVASALTGLQEREAIVNCRRCAD